MENNQDIFITRLYEDHTSEVCFMPCKTDTNRFVNDVIQLLFPLDIPRTINEYRLRFKDVELQFRKLLHTIGKILADDPEDIIQSFFGALPDIYSKLRKDAESINKFDPASGNLQEVIHAYPGFFAIMVYRISHLLLQLNVPVLPRVISEYSHGRTGIDIHPGALIGDSFFIDHGTGVVIGETTQIGNNVKIYQGVTLGALTVEKSLASTKRHPTIEDNVIIYAGSTVLGGKTVVGHDSVIGGNVWLTESVPPRSVVYHKSQVKIRKGNSVNDPINFVI
jgi:serine O-acetyltransferase